MAPAKDQAADGVNGHLQPRHHMRRKSSRRSIAEEIAYARRTVDENEARDRAPDSEEDQEKEESGEDESGAETPLETVDYAFAFDIDGVLLKGGTPIPEAAEALKILNGANPMGVKVPYIFLTNGGGKLEDLRCRDLSQKLDIPVSPLQFIQSHTPMRAFAEQFNTVLVVGGEGDSCRHIAENYGFKDVVIPGDIIAWEPSVVPFRKLTEKELEHCRPRNFRECKIDAIFVFADSRDWAGDQQIILELLTSVDGVMGTVSETYDEGPPIFFSNPDVVWATPYSLPRYGMGALRKCIETLYEEATQGRKLKCTQLGKPHATTYDYATSVLTEWRRTHAEMPEDQPGAEPRYIYMVGDNPESDIRGANTHGWESILVKTGVFRDAENSDKYPAKFVCENVLDAVNMVMNLHSAPKGPQINVDSEETAKKLQNVQINPLTDSTA